MILAKQGQMVSACFLSSSILLTVLQSLLASPVTTWASVCGGENGCCASLSVMGFYASAGDFHGEVGMISGL